MSTLRRRPLRRPAGPRILLVGAVALLAFTGAGATDDPAPAPGAPAPCGLIWTPAPDCG